MSVKFYELRNYWFNIFFNSYDEVSSNTVRNYSCPKCLTLNFFSEAIWWEADLALLIPSSQHGTPLYFAPQFVTLFDLFNSQRSIKRPDDLELISSKRLLRTENNPFQSQTFIFPSVKMISINTTNICLTCINGTINGLLWSGFLTQENICWSSF